jgi:serine acetyltransferase
MQLNNKTGYLQHLYRDFQTYGGNRHARILCPIVAIFKLGCWLIITYRTAHAASKIPIIGNTLANLFELVMQISTGCHISGRSHIGDYVEFPHPTGIVIGTGVIIQDHVVIYQHVTLGVKRRGLEEYPVIGHHSVIYPFSLIVGKVTITEHSVIKARSSLHE